MTAVPDVDLPQELVDRAMGLPAAARFKLADMLLQSADDPELVRAEWNEVIAARAKAYAEGRLPTRDALDVVDEIDTELDAKYPL